MSEKMLIQHCAPTLAGIKTGSLFSCRTDDMEQIKATVRRLNRRLSGKGLCILPIRHFKGRALIYVYRPCALSRDLRDAIARDILSARGYEPQDAAKCVAKLIRVLREKEEFPHEIGLFLGYPPEDVKGFIDHNAEGFLSVGYWKVYGDEKQAEKLFAKFRKCTNVYCRRFEQGSTLERLTVRAAS